MPAPRVDDEATDRELEPIRAQHSSSSSTIHEKNAQHGFDHVETRSRSASGSRRGSFRVRQPSVSALLRNPLAGKSEEDVLDDVDIFIEENGLQHEKEAFRKGALLARVSQRLNGFENVDAISEDEKAALRHEIEHRWSQPFMLYFLVVLCAGSAIVQGMDQTAVNGAQVCALHASLLIL